APAAGRMPSRRAVTAGAAAALGLALAARPGIARAANSTLTVRAEEAIGPVTRAASGGLYALRDNTFPADSLLLPLRMHSVTQPAPRVGQRPNGQPPGGDALVTAPKADRTGAAVIIRMPDIYPDFPYRWVSWNDWLGRVDLQVQDRLAATAVSNIEGWELWNEPDWTWDTAAAGPFNDGWTRTFRRVRALDPVTPIVGPSTTHYRRDYIRSFLTATRAAGTLPDIMCWHELGGPADIAANVADYRAMEQQLGISPRPIAINEYGAPEEMNIPGVMVSYLAKFERARVRSAHRAFWHEYGTVGGLLTPQGQPTGVYWLYTWYGELAGSMVATSPPSRTGIDGFAAHDRIRRRVDVVFGNESGNNTVVVTGLGDLGSQVRVRLESTPVSDRFTHVGGPALIGETVHSVSGGRITVPVQNMSATSAYRMVITPAGGQPAPQQRWEAENASVFRADRRSSGSASHHRYVGGIDNTGDFRTDSYVDFIVQVPATRSYRLTIGYANATGATATQGLAWNGGPWTEVRYAPTGAWGSFGATATATVDLRAGYNTIRLAKGAPYYSGGAGYAEVDYIQLD
ncbi:hypothetical protein, partial [Streptomyces sp. YIM 98790]|uniref:hypothetical protein n=1 Tax=Streptomyces sp. YIM 98790 TaxID=2689077 RepID=UPI001A9E61FE